MPGVQVLTFGVQQSDPHSHRFRLSFCGPARSLGGGEKRHTLLSFSSAGTACAKAFFGFFKAGLHAYGCLLTAARFPRFIAVPAACLWGHALAVASDEFIPLPRQLRRELVPHNHVVSVALAWKRL